jgi:1-acyl-sn-glycerol-3-phosphate acyltransferase
MSTRSLGDNEKLVGGYDHKKWEYPRRFFRFLLRTVGSLLFKVDRVNGLEYIPQEGPVVLMMNHIAFVDPIVVLHVMPRLIVPLGKIEAFRYPVIGLIPRLWGAIPVHRGEVDRRTLRSALEVLEAGEILLLAPEGTRSPSLQKGLVGVAYLAGRSGVPIIPVTLQNTAGYPSFPILPRWREPGASVSFGRPFRYKEPYRRPKRKQLRQMTEEAMYILAAMLPEYQRGVYADLGKATEETIEWVDST